MMASEKPLGMHAGSQGNNQHSRGPEKYSKYFSKPPRFMRPEKVAALPPQYIEPSMKSFFANYLSYYDRQKVTSHIEIMQCLPFLGDGYQ